MLDAALAALLTITDPTRLLMLVVGVAVGLLVGIMPGLGGTVGMSLVLPFIFGMDPNTAMALLIGMVAVIHTADTFPSVLLGVPGSSGSQATIMDGYPLAQKGEAGRAFGAAFFASMIGGVFGAAAIFALLPVARPLVLALGSPELFMLAILGLSMVGVLSGNKPILGVLAGALGLLLGSVGAAPAEPHYRYTFDLLYLFDGLPLAVVALGLFAARPPDCPPQHRTDDNARSRMAHRYQGCHSSSVAHAPLLADRRGGRIHTRVGRSRGRLDQLRAGNADNSG